MNKKDQKVKDVSEKLKTEDNKIEGSLEKSNNKKDKTKDKDNNNISRVETQANKNNNLKTNNNLNKNTTQKESNIKNTVEPSQEDHNNANSFLEYIDESGLPQAFQLIFAELISKKINPQNYYSYVGMRLRQIGKEINDMKNN